MSSIFTFAYIFSNVPNLLSILRYLFIFILLYGSLFTFFFLTMLYPLSPSFQNTHINTFDLNDSKNNNPQIIISEK